jgi:photosystem II stability/assembly factor-like uncharacterized protein
MIKTGFLMLFSWVATAGSADHRQHTWWSFPVIASLLILPLWGSQARAGWTDPLDTPASFSGKAHQALLLATARAGQRLLVAGAYGDILYSDDMGKQWQQASVPVRVTLTAMTFADDTHGWACGHDGIILATTDGGLTWRRQLDGFRANKAVVEAAEQALAAADENLAELEDNGADTRAAEAAQEEAGFALDDARYDLQSGSTRPFLDIYFADAQNGFAVGAYGMFFVTTDGGQHWQESSARLQNPERFHINFIKPVGDHGWWMGGENGLLLTSMDNGASWQSEESPYDGSLFSIGSLGDSLLLSGLRGHVFLQSPRGEWQELDTGNEQTLVSIINLGEGKGMLVGNAGTLLELGENGQLIRQLTLADSKSLAAIMKTDSGFLLVGEGGLLRLNEQMESQPVSLLMSGVVQGDAE